MAVMVSDWMDAPVRLEGREFAIGDVHGRSDLLSALLGAMGDASGGEGELTFLGDLIDRGPDSLGALRLAARPAVELGFARSRLLVGNHEGFLRSYIDGKGPLGLWACNGGVAFLKELGYETTADVNREELIERLGPELLTLVRGAIGWRESGNVLFVHGGVDPRVPLAEWLSSPPDHWVDEDHYTWVRFPFLGWEGEFEGGRVVVHGHTPEPMALRWKGRGGEEPHRLDGWRLGLDGGSYQTGQLVGAELRDGAYRVFIAS